MLWPLAVISTVPVAVLPSLVAVMVQVPALPTVKIAVPVLVLVRVVVPHTAVTVEPLSTVTVMVAWNCVRAKDMAVK